ncbi:O-antigen ligase family protein [Rhodoferax mekongensis]|uniref:O-antigen ligase family protein n=1 Tax=Rhodoferax mekongensis TaxID=3068341 RepID=A0ABZ0B2V1_9BURK|nr:O-antigen ligase family protein [Rhodoferax sp. TBRC 17307]WNO06254.1 O-antigen ligase family protein [Rhodoferax sp. TBRC 17307]
MSEIDTVLRSWPLLAGAMLFALALVLGFASFVHLGSNTRMELLGVYFVGVPLAMATAVILGGRDLTRMADSPFEIDLSAAESGNWISRGLTLLCLGIAAERLVRYYLKKDYRHAKGKGLVWAALFYILGSNMMPALLGTARGFTHQTLYALPIFMAIFAYAQGETVQILRWTRNTLLGFLALSLLWLAINPTLVAETNYRAGIIPGATLRFYGFATHPNTLAPLCLVLLGCLRLQPFARTSLNALSWAVAGLALALTQSKTSFFLVGLALLYFWYFDSKRLLVARGSMHYQRWSLKLVTLAVGGAAAIAAFVLYSSLSGGSIGDRLADFFDNNQFGTLTGRTQIWTATFQALADNPAFGYGPGLWGIEFRNKTGLQFTHAHNQYIQTLGSAGIVGLVTLIIYLAAFGLFAWRANRCTRGVSIGLFLFIVFRGITEVPLKMDNPFQSEFLTQMFLLALCVGSFPAPPASEATVRCAEPECASTPS